MVLFDAVSRPPRELLRPEACPFDSTASLVARTRHALPVPNHWNVEAAWFLPYRMKNLPLSHSVNELLVLSIFTGRKVIAGARGIFLCLLLQF